MNYLNLFQMLFDGDDGDYIPPSRRPLSAAGRLLHRLDSSDARLKKEGITDELRAALRRCEIKSMRGTHER